MVAPMMKRLPVLAFFIASAVSAAECPKEMDAGTVCLTKEQMQVHDALVFTKGQASQAVQSQERTAADVESLIAKQMNASIAKP